METFKETLVAGVELEIEFAEDSAFLDVRNTSIYPLFVFTKDDTEYNTVPIVLLKGERFARPIVTDAIKCLSSKGGDVEIISVPTAEYSSEGETGATGAQGPQGDAGADGANGPVCLTVTIDGQGQPLEVGEIDEDTFSPYDFTITGWTVISKEAGSIEIDVWKDSYSNFPATVADTITGTEKPTLSSSQKNQNNALTDWIVDVSTGDLFRYKIDSTDGIITKVKLMIYGIRA